MYRTSANIATHEEPWATVIRLGLQDVHHWMWLCHDERSPWEYGIPVFDRLTIGQKLSVLVQVGRALLIKEEPEPELTAVVEAAVAVIFQGVLSGIHTECEMIEGHDDFKVAVLSIFKSEPPLPDDLPEETCDDVAEWESLVAALEGEILWDDDYLDEVRYMDTPPEHSEFMKEVMDVDKDYFTHVPPDPADEQLDNLAEELRLLGTGGHRV